MEFWKYFNGKTDKIYCQARYEVREKERTRRVPRLCLEQQEEREAINQDGENWPCSFGGWEWASLQCSFEQVRFGGVHETSKGRAE